MKRSLSFPLVALALLFTACSSAAPSAPMGLSRRPANTPETLASLARPPAAPTATAAAPTAPPPPTHPIPASAPVLPSQRLTVFVVSDASAPGGIESVAPAQREAVVAAARTAETVRLLCRGDRARPSRAGWSAAVTRGLRVKRFLVVAGIDTRRIRVFARSAGAFVADNSTPSGRAQNRRVEIHFE